MKVTVDTNALPIDDLRTMLEPKGFEFVVVTVTDRELENTSLRRSMRGLRQVPETAVWDESRWDQSVWGSANDEDVLEKALEIISHGSFPKSGQRAQLSPGERRQLRDAMIACTHVRCKHDILLNERPQRLHQRWSARTVSERAGH